MRRVGIGLTTLLGLVAICLGVVSGSAAAGAKKLVEGTVYDTTCATACSPCPPPCGPVPVPVPQAHGDHICAQASQRRIVCPLAKDRGAGPDFCIQGQPCGVVYPIYGGEGAVVNVRRRGSSTVLATLPVREGHFTIRLAPGAYVFRPYLPEPQCWSGEKAITSVGARAKSPVPATLDVSNRCAMHPDAK